jgi:LexA-binding, inner membrane-associated putative hydrolase
VHDGRPEPEDPLETETTIDTFSHAAWGHAVLRGRGRRMAWWGALAGAAPDLLFYVPHKIEQLVGGRWDELMSGRDPAVWRAGGPPLPPDLVTAYHRYYVWTHSLLVLAVAMAIVWALGRRRWLWLAIPYALHVAMDIPTHERYLTQPLYPLSSWSFSGLSWSDPRILVPNVLALVAVHLWLWRRYRRPHPANGRLESAAEGSGDG